MIRRKRKMEKILTESDRREAYIKAYVKATISSTEQENWRTVKRQRDVAARVYDIECKWSLK